MGVEHRLLQAFLRVVQNVWKDRVQKAAYCTLDSLLPTDAGVRVVVSWVNKDRSSRTWEKTYPMDYFFGHTLRLSWEARDVLRRPCDFSRDIIRDVLSQRGAL